MADEPDFKMLFKPIRIGAMRIKNRIVLPAMGTSLADRQGQLTDRLIAYYCERAKGGAGYLTVEHACVHPSGRAHEKMVCLYDDRYIEGFARLAKAVHREGGKVVVQLNHAGRQTLSAIAGEQPVAPSAIACPIMKEVPRALSPDEIQSLVQAFCQAAFRVKAAGCDGVEFHMAHGYLICQFLSPFTNQRQDEYGGDIARRCRFALDVLESTRRKVGPDFPLVCRISADEMVEGGLRIEASKIIARHLQKAGADAIHVSACNYASYAFNMPCYYLEEGCFGHLAAEIKSVVDVPVIAVGRIRTPFMAEALLQRGQADLVAMGRALIADPFLPQKAFAGAVAEIRPCLSCNRCVESISLDKLACTVNPDVGAEFRLQRAQKVKAKRVLVVGAGPAGMETAKVAAERGHHVTLYEAQTQLGGQLRQASLPPMKKGFRELIAYYQHLLPRRGVKIITGQACTANIVEQEKPEVVIIATGSRCRILNSDPVCINVVSYTEALNDCANLGNQILIVGGGPKGAELADYLATMGKTVTIVERMRKIGLGLPTSIRFHLEKRLQQAHVNIMTRTEVLDVIAGGARVKVRGVEKEINGFDAVILAVGRTPETSMKKDLKRLSLPVFVVGDASKPLGVKEAVAAGAGIARQL